MLSFHAIAYEGINERKKLNVRAESLVLTTLKLSP